MTGKKRTHVSPNGAQQSAELTFGAQDLDWSDLATIKIQPSNIFVAQVQRDGHLVNIGMAYPPVKEPKGGIKAGQIRVQVVARLWLSERDIEGLVDVLQRNIENRKKQLTREFIGDPHEMDASYIHLIGGGKGRVPLEFVPESILAASCGTRHNPFQAHWRFK